MHGMTIWTGSNATVWRRVEHRNAERHHGASTDEQRAGAALGDGTEKPLLRELATLHRDSLANQTSF